MIKRAEPEHKMIETKDKPRFVKSQIKLTIGILVSNQIKYIRKAMESISPILKKVPSELIVVDTVGQKNSDGSLSVAMEYTDKVYHFDWIDDFSAARNVAFEHASGEWFMFFDDDEIFDDVSEIINFFNSDECNDYNYAQYYVVNYTSGDRYQKDVVGRLVRRTENTRFVGVIHECFNEAYPPVKQFNTFVHHYGYLFTTKEQLEEKNKRNIRLLEKAFEKDGPSIRLCVQMVQQLMVPDPEEAVKRCDSYLKLYENTKELETPIGQWLIVSKLRIKAILGDIKAVLECEKEILDKYELNETSRLVMAHRVACVAASFGEYKLAADRVALYFRYLDLLNSNDKIKNDQILIDLSSFMTGERLFEITKIGMISENALMRYDMAYNYMNRLDTRYCNNLGELITIIENTLSHLSSIEPMIEFYKNFYRDELFEEHTLNKYLPDLLRVHLNKKEQQDS